MKRVSCLNLKETSWRNKDKHKNYWQLEHNHRQREQKVTVPSKGLELAT